MWTVLRPSLEEAYGPRDESKCLYMNDTVACTFLAATMLKCRSKNAIDGCRNTEAMAASILDLSGQSWWPEGEKRTTACTETLVYRMKGWDAGKIRVTNAKLVRHLINAKFFESDRLRGFYCVAVDAVHRDERRNRIKRLGRTLHARAGLCYNLSRLLTAVSKRWRGVSDTPRQFRRAVSP